MILVTGATGFIGSELTRQLVSRGDRVRILRRDTATLDLLGDTVSFVESVLGDVTNADSLLYAMNDVQQVYHVAGFIGFGWRRDKRMLYRINVEGTANVVNAALKAGISRLVHTSSIAALGRPEGLSKIIDESATWHRSHNNSLYAYTKYQGELEVQRGIAEGLDAVIVNPALVFGNGRKNENTRLIVEKIRDQKIPVVPIGGTNVVDVVDVAAGHILAMQHGKTGERYVLSGENLSWQEIFETIANALDVAPPRRKIPLGTYMTLAAILEFAAMVSGSRPRITRETARLATRVVRYDNTKAVEQLGCTFRSFNETTKRLAKDLITARG